MRGARNPSVSADGRFVAFSTGQRLVPADVNGNIDVYVRDMATGAYELISARDGGSVPASYAARDPDTPLRNPGADVSPGVAISADGDRVAVPQRRRRVRSARPRGGRHAALQPVRARALDAAHACWSRPTSSAAPRRAARPVGGALSADGTTAAWPGQNAGDQTHFLDGESPDSSFFYYLWRRVDSGVTRRITGPAEPEVQGCNSYDPRPGDVGPCTGPLSDREQSLAGITSTLPALSADGRRVLFVTGAPQRPPTPGFNTDLWMTDMHDGVSRTAGSVELTREGGRDPADSSGITAVSLSPDGRYARGDQRAHALPVARAAVDQRRHERPGHRRALRDRPRGGHDRARAARLQRRQRRRQRRAAALDLRRRDADRVRLERRQPVLRRRQPARRRVRGRPPRRGPAAAGRPGPAGRTGGRAVRRSRARGGEAAGDRPPRSRGPDPAAGARAGEGQADRRRPRPRARHATAACAGRRGCSGPPGRRSRRRARSRSTSRWPSATRASRGASASSTGAPRSRSRRRPGSPSRARRRVRFAAPPKRR